MQSRSFGRRSASAVLTSLLTIFASGAPASAGDPPQLVKDINVQAAGADPQAFADVNGTAFFFACDGSHNLMLFTSDGTGSGTTPIKRVAGCDVSQNEAIVNQDSQPEIDDVAVGDLLFFVPVDYSSENLWVSDGTPSGTFVLNEDVTLRNIGPLTSVAGKLLFQAGSTSGTGLWTSDGTPAGTVLLKNGFASSEFATLGGSVYVSRGPELWKTDGTAPGTLKVKRVAGSCQDTAIESPTATSSRIFFIACSPGTSERQLWTSNGTDAGTHRVRDTDANGKDRVGNLTAVGAALYFTARDASHGVELWKSNGTSAGTGMVKDLHPGAGAGSAPSALLAVGGRLSFTADNGTDGRRLYTSDGTSGGTNPIKNVVPAEQLAVGATLYFATAASDALWVSNGTSAGTQPLPDIDPTGDAGPESLGSVLGLLFFSADDGTHGRETWTSNGTAGSTAMLKDIDTATLGSGFTPLAKLDGKLLFAADGGPDGRQLWTTDDTEPGTKVVEDVAPSSFAKIGASLYFMSDRGGGSFDEWKSDGSPDGTYLVKHIPHAATRLADNAPELTGLGSKLYFTAGGSDGGPGAIWVSNGTSGGTHPLTSWSDGYPLELTRVGSRLYFAVITYDADCHVDCDHWHLWKSDGTPGGTSPVSTMEFYGIANLTAAGSTAFFTDGAGTSLYKSDGTPSGTRRVRSLQGGDPVAENLTAVGTTLFFTASRYDSATADDVPQLWVSDGTKAGTRVLHEFTLPRGPGQLTVVGSLLYFAADDRTDTCCGYQLWRSDGTIDGTYVVSAKSFGPSAFPYPLNTNPSSLTNIDGTLYFAAQSDASNQGLELWTSDGTDLGTAKVVDLDPTGSSAPGAFFKLGSTLLFSADDGVHGAEPWSLPLP